MLTNDCPCPGHNITFQCSTIGQGSTVWLGDDVFDCPDHSNEIILRHINFASTVIGKCNAGAIVGSSLSVTDNSYTSELNVMYMEDFTGKSITCVHDNGIATTAVGSLPITHSLIGKKLSLTIGNNFALRFKCSFVSSAK